MSIRDEDEFDEPLSSRRALERADHGKSDRKEKVVRKQELQKLRLDLLKQNVGKQTEKGKGDDQQQDAQDMTTKTLMQEAAQEIETADAKPGAEQMIRGQQREDAKKKQTPYEQAQNNLG